MGYLKEKKSFYSKLSLAFRLELLLEPVINAPSLALRFLFKGIDDFSGLIISLCCFEWIAIFSGSYP